MNEQWIAVTRGGGSVDRPDEFRACGTFPTFEQAEHWLEQEFGEMDKMSESEQNYFQPQVIRIETPEEF